MSLWCLLGRHDWRGCKCDRCGEMRNEEHRWQGCICAGCGMRRDAEHRWVGCRCPDCGAKRNVEHQWDGCKCTGCGRTRDEGHDWGELRCKKCNSPLPLPIIRQRWAAELARQGDYAELAHYPCVTRKTLIRERHGTEISPDEWEIMRQAAREALRAAGGAGVAAMVAALDTAEVPDEGLALLLAELDDPRAAPVVQKYADRRQFPNEVTQQRLRAFLDRHPEQLQPVEIVSCGFCHKAHPVTEMEECRGERFCPGNCWAHRGRIVNFGIGRDCPWNTEGVCNAGGRDRGLCTLAEGGDFTACGVYSRLR
ncbi:MAG: hypothetical protein ACYC7E_05715 [Armatimonadota bacterium]